MRLVLEGSTKNIRRIYILFIYSRQPQDLPLRFRLRCYLLDDGGTEASALIRRIGGEDAGPVTIYLRLRITVELRFVIVSQG